MAVCELPSVRLYGASSEGALRSAAASSAPLPPRLLEMLITSATVCFGWALLALPASASSRQPTATASSKGQPRAQLSCKEILWRELETQISRMFYNSKRHVESLVCSYAGDWLHPWVTFLLPNSQTICQEPDPLCLQTSDCRKASLPNLIVGTVRVREMAVMDSIAESPAMSKKVSPASSRSAGVAMLWTAVRNELWLCIWSKMDRLLLIEFAKARQLQSQTCILRGIHICILYCYICSTSTARNRLCPAAMKE